MDIAEILREIKPEYIYTVRQISQLLENTHHDKRAYGTIAKYAREAYREEWFVRSRIAKRGSPYGYQLSTRRDNKHA